MGSDCTWRSWDNSCQRHNFFSNGRILPLPGSLWRRKSAAPLPREGDSRRSEVTAVRTSPIKGLSDDCYIHPSSSSSSDLWQYPNADHRLQSVGVWWGQINTNNRNIPLRALPKHTRSADHYYHIYIHVFACAAVGAPQNAVALQSWNTHTKPFSEKMTPTSCFYPTPS